MHLSALTLQWGRTFCVTVTSFVPIDRQQYSIPKGCCTHTPYKQHELPLPLWGQHHLMPLPLTIFLITMLRETVFSLLFKSTAPQGNFKQRFHCTGIIASTHLGTAELKTEDGIYLHWCSVVFFRPLTRQMPGNGSLWNQVTTTSCHIHFNSLFSLPTSMYCMDPSTLCRA